MTDNTSADFDKKVKAAQAIGMKAKEAQRLMNDIRADPYEKEMFEAWQEVFQRTHKRAPTVEDAFIAATVKERLAAPGGPTLSDCTEILRLNVLAGSELARGMIAGLWSIVKSKGV